MSAPATCSDCGLELELNDDGVCASCEQQRRYDAASDDPVLSAVAEAARGATVAREAFEAAVRAAHPARTVRAIAEAAGLSPSRIGQLVHPGAKP